MKHGKNPTREQKKIIKANGLNADNWLVGKVYPDRLELVHMLTHRHFQCRIASYATATRQSGLACGTMRRMLPLLHTDNVRMVYKN